MAADPVYLKWLDGGVVFKSAFATVDEAVAQAQAYQRGTNLGVFDGPDDDAKKLADVKEAK